MKYITTIEDQEYIVELVEEGVVKVNGKEYHVDFDEVSGQKIFSLIIDGKSFEAHVSEGEQNLWNILLRGSLYEADVIDEREKRLTEAAGVVVKGSSVFMLRSPMPGLVTKLPISLEDKVETGDVLIILESMKMQNELKSPQAGIISEIRISEGENVDQNQILVVVEPFEKND